MFYEQQLDLYYFSVGIKNTFSPSSPAPRKSRDQCRCPRALLIWNPLSVIKVCRNKHLLRDRVWKRRSVLLFPILMHCLLTKTSGSLLVAVIGGDCSNSSHLISKDFSPHLPKMEQWAAEGVQSQSSYFCVWSPLGGSRKETMWGRDTGSSNCVIDLVSLRALRLQCTWDWIVTCGSTGILIVLQPERTEQAKPRWKGALCHEGALFSILGSDEGLFVLTGQPVSEGHTPHLYWDGFHTRVGIFCSVDTVQ